VSSRSPFRITNFLQAKEYLPSAALRRIVALQTELMKDTTKSKGKPSALSTDLTLRVPTTQRTLLSSNFGSIVNPLQNGAKAANLLSRSVISAGDRFRDLIIPDALAALVSTPNWLPGIGSAKASGKEKTVSEKKLETMRTELEELLSSNCPLCENVVAGLDKPFVAEGEIDASWTL
jgi:hypothetical protein